ncbi:MAG: hypothetical protein IJB83_04825 [Bacilli bacterium]|nr:hypothetical protein [Bacilli bacterium]
MYENKVLINLYIVSLDKRFEIFIPVNEKVGNISKLFNITLFDSIDNSKNTTIVNAETGKYYLNNELIINTDIRNGSNLILL